MVQGCVAFQDVLYSGSHNAIEIWDTQGKMRLCGTIRHNHGSVHALTVTDKYIITGNEGKISPLKVTTALLAWMTKLYSRKAIYASCLPPAILSSQVVSLPLQSVIHPEISSL